MDDDLDSLSRDALVAEVKKLRQAIRVHRDASGHDLCWHHPDLWSLLPEQTSPVITVPAWPQFMQGCIRYRQSLDLQAPHAARSAQEFSASAAAPPTPPEPQGPTQTMQDDRTLRTARTLPYPPEAVYAAFASGPVLASWWGPNGFTNTFHTFDFTVGGAWTFTMHGPDGKDYANTSYFAELVPSVRVVIRHDCAPYFTLTVRLTQVEGGTHLVWEQAFDDATTARAVQAVVGPANEQNLDRLTRALGRGHGAACA